MTLMTEGRARSDISIFTTPLIDIEAIDKPEHDFEKFIGSMEGALFTPRQIREPNGSGEEEAKDPQLLGDVQEPLPQIAQVSN